LNKTNEVSIMQQWFRRIVAETNILNNQPVETSLCSRYK
jgi:hypothetical protein